MQELLDSVNASITLKNRKRKHKPTFETYHDMDPKSPSMTGDELRLIVAALHPDYESVAAVKTAKLSNAELVLQAYALLPSVAVLGRRTTLAEVFSSVLPTLRTRIRQFAQTEKSQARVAVPKPEQEVLDQIIALEGKKSQKLKKEASQHPLPQHRHCEP